MDDTEDIDVLDDTVYHFEPISRHRMFSVLLQIDEVNAEGEVLSTVKRFEGIESGEDITRLIDENKRLKALTAWDDERRNKFWSLLESHADAHRQLHYPGIEDIDTEDTPVMDDAQRLFTLRAQIAQLIGMPELPKDEVQS